MAEERAPGFYWVIENPDAAPEVMEWAAAGFGEIMWWRCGEPTGMSSVHWASGKRLQPPEPRRTP